VWHVNKYLVIDVALIRAMRPAGNDEGDSVKKSLALNCATSWPDYLFDKGALHTLRMLYKSTSKSAAIT